jgi:hypothetical protein
MVRRIQGLHFHRILMTVILHSSGDSIVPTRHRRQRILIHLDRWRAGWRLEPRNLGSTVNRGTWRSTIAIVCRHRRRLMIPRVIKILRSWSFVSRGRAATRAAPATARATLDTAAQTINHARNHRDEDDGADNDTNDDGPSNLISVSISK